MIHNAQAAPSTRRTSIGVKTPPFLQPFVDHAANVLVMTNRHTRVLLQPLSPPPQSQQVTDHYDACYYLAFLSRQLVFQCVCAPSEVHIQALLCNLSSLDVCWLIQGDLLLRPVASNRIPNMARIIPGTMFAQ